jgi:steroid 5-alpha reductase family enzyme
VIGSAWDLLAVGAVLASASMALLWVLQVRIRDASHVDVAWAILIACAATLYALLANGNVQHRVLAAGLAAVWGVRLGLYLLFDRVLGKPEDGRYRALREKWARARTAGSSGSSSCRLRSSSFSHCRSRSSRSMPRTGSGRWSESGL